MLHSSEALFANSLEIEAPSAQTAYVCPPGLLCCKNEEPGKPNPSPRQYTSKHEYQAWQCTAHIGQGTTPQQVIVCNVTKQAQPKQHQAVLQRPLPSISLGDNN
eukprot:1150152-Pelagomonas_calceolata.AAC.1